MADVNIKWHFTGWRRTLLISALALPAPYAAHAELMLYPTRVIIDGRQRGAQVEIVNRGSKPETYRIRIVNRRMSDTGEILVADEAEAKLHFADEMLVYTPRQVTLQPGGAQTVRIAARRPAGLADGEYRSHLQFDRMADASAASDIENIGKPEHGEVAIALQALVGASIPVIVRQGVTEATVTLEELKLITSNGQGPSTLGFVFRRQGNRSVYGNVVATYAAPGKKPVKIASVDGVAVYVPNVMRVAQLPLALPKDASLHGGTITLRYTQPQDAGGKTIAEQTLLIP